MAIKLKSTSLKNIVKVIIGEKAEKRRRRRRVVRRPKVAQVAQVAPPYQPISNLGAVASAGQSILNTITQKQTEAITNINAKLTELEKRREMYNRLYREPVKASLGDIAISHHSSPSSTLAEVGSTITGSLNSSLTKGQEEGAEEEIYQSSSLLSKRGQTEPNLSTYEPIEMGQFDDIDANQRERDFYRDVRRVDAIEERLRANRLSEGLSSSSSSSSSSMNAEGGGSGGGIMGEAFVSSPSQTGLAFGMAQVAEPIQQQEVISAVVKTREELKRDLERLTLPRLMEEVLAAGVDFTPYIGITATGSYYVKGKDKKKKASKKQNLIQRIIDKKFQ